MTEKRFLAAIAGAVLLLAATVPLLVAAVPLAAQAQELSQEKGDSLPTYTQGEVTDAASAFFGEASEEIATAMNRLFSESGEPNAIITGDEISGALFVGVTYGEGLVRLKDGTQREIFWQGPSVGFDFGANSAKVFMLVYDLEAIDDLYRVFPGAEGRGFVLGGVGVHYLQEEGISIAPVRVGAGLRLGLSVGYLRFGKESTGLPF